MRLGRRSAFFGALAVVSLLLWEPTPPEYRWVNLLAAALAAFWAVAAALEDRSLGRWRPADGRAKPPGDAPADDAVRRS